MPPCRALMTLALVAALSPLAAARAVAQEDWALEGHDPVAYFDEGEATSGRSDLMLEWRGAIYHFASEDNLLQFESNPRSYVPQFDGLCVGALAEGREVPGDPAIFVLHDGALYLMRDPAVREQFLADPEGMIDAARRARGQ